MIEEQKEADELDARSKDIPYDAELEQTLIQLKEKLFILIKRANQGITLVTVIYFILFSKRITHFSSNSNISSFFFLIF